MCFVTSQLNPDGRKDILNIISEKVRIHHSRYLIPIRNRPSFMLKNHSEEISFNSAWRKTLFIQFYRQVWTWLVQCPMVWLECLCRILMEGKLYAMGAHLHVTRGPLQAEQITLWFKTCNLFIRWSFFRRLHEPSSPINLASLLLSFPFRNDAEQFVEVPFRWFFFFLALI